MKMSCNGCRVLRKGCSENCIIRPCLQWIKNPESQANATVFLAKFYGRAGLMNLIAGGPEHLRPAIFRSLLYEACGRLANPVYGSTGLLMSGRWRACQEAVESILKGCPIKPSADEDKADQLDQSPSEPSKQRPGTLMEAIARELHKVKTKGRFKRATAKQRALALSFQQHHSASCAEDRMRAPATWQQQSPVSNLPCHPHDAELASTDSSCCDCDCDSLLPRADVSNRSHVGVRDHIKMTNGDEDVLLELQLTLRPHNQTQCKQELQDEETQTAMGMGGGMGMKADAEPGSGFTCLGLGFSAT